MLKRLLFLSLIFFYFPAMAATFYVIPEILYDDFKNDGADRYRGLQPRISIGGFGYRQGYVLLGGEIFLSPLKDYTLNGNNDSSSLRPEVSYGISFVPVILLDEFVRAFLRFGALRTNFDCGPNLTGYMLGGGMDFHLWENISARAEYIYTRYNATGEVGSIRSNQFGLGIVYHWGGDDCKV